MIVTEDSDIRRGLRHSTAASPMVQDIFGMIRRVYRWADGRRSYRYKIVKSERIRPRDEYEPDDHDRHDNA